LPSRGEPLKLTHESGRIKGVPRGELGAVVERLMAQMQLARFANKLAGTLSGGNDSHGRESHCHVPLCMFFSVRRIADEVSRGLPHV
jgi:hypothetical protein